MFRCHRNRAPTTLGGNSDVSTEVHGGSLYVTRLCGPADEGPDRARWEFVFPRIGAPCVRLRRDEVVVLAAALANSAADIPSGAATAGDERP